MVFIKFAIFESAHLVIWTKKTKFHLLPYTQNKKYFRVTKWLITPNQQGFFISEMSEDEDREDSGGVDPDDDDAGEHHLCIFQYDTFTFELPYYYEFGVLEEVFGILLEPLEQYLSKIYRLTDNRKR